MGRSRYKITEPQQPHFVTLTVSHWIPVFTRPETVEILFDSLHFLAKDGLKVYAWVVLENHCHFVLQSNALDIDIARLKSWTASRLIQYLDEQNVSWKEWFIGGLLPMVKQVCIPTQERGNEKTTAKQGLSE